MDFLEIGQTKLAYQIAGTGFPLVLIHAGIADSRMWQTQFEALRQQYRVLTYDMRGYGQTPAVPESYSQHDDLAQLLKKLEIEKAVLLGCSFGGRVAIDFALAYPEHVQALILANPAIAGFEYKAELPPLVDEIDAAAEADDLDLVAELEVRLWVDGLYRDPIDSSIRELVRVMNRHALINDLNPIGDEHELEPLAITRLEELTQPILLITGELDLPSSLARSEALKERVPQIQHVVMKGTAHLPNLEQPAKFNQHILSFLGQVIEND